MRSSEPKRKNTYTLFDVVADRYDLLNHVLSINIDKRWRRELLRRFAPRDGELILDGCAGTCDVALETARRAPKARIVGLDGSPAMLSLGREKLSKAGVDGAVELIEGDMLDLPFADDTFDAVTVGFGLRNLFDHRAGLLEMKRVLKPGGRILILEFGPPMPGIRWAWYRWYLKIAVPFIGGLLTGRRKNYAYLARSIDGFMSEAEVTAIFGEVGFEDVEAKRLTGGIAILYTAGKPAGAADSERPQSRTSAVRSRQTAGENHG